MRVGALVSGLCLLGIALAAQGWGGLTALLAVGGLANGAIQPAANGYLAQTVAQGRQGLAFGAKQAAIPAATLLAGLAVPAASGVVGWRTAFVLASALAVLAGVTVPGVRRSAERSETGPVLRRTPRFARGPLITLALAIGLGSAAGNALGAFFVPAAVHEGLTAATAGFVAAASSLASLLMRLTIGHRADRRSSGHLRSVATLCAVGSAGMLLIALGGPGLLVLGAVIAWAAGWGWAGLFNFAIAASHPAAPARATGLTQLGASTGAAAGPLAFGVLVGHVGYDRAWLVVGAGLAVAAPLMLRGRAQLLASLAISD
jgi:cyanate permease